MAAIRLFARQIAERFKPDKIILFGSYAYGTPHADSDVDLLVVMPAAREVTQAIRIRMALPAPFPLDLIVRTPERLARELEDCDWFLREIIEKGKVLYDKKNRPMGSQGRGQLSTRGKDLARKRAVS
ncbi:MAG TPA: nucleotidyltransferase domain-containing protein [Gemmataceae bacterium]|nr:nucleotidyltransferase domain-containing protein [Gemmataceae bacterium]